MSKVDIGCPLCIADGVDDSEATKAIHVSNDPRFVKNGRQTGRCMRSGHHPHGGPVDYYLDTGELVRKVEQSPFDFIFNEAPELTKAFGIASKLFTNFGIRALSPELADQFREKYPELGKKVPSRKILSIAHDSGYPIIIHPLYNQTEIIGFENRIDQPKTSLRPGEYGSTSSGKQVRVIGESGLFIATPYPIHTTEIIVIFEGAKDACIAAIDNYDGDMNTVVFCGCSASFKYELIANTIHLRFPGVTLISIGDRDKAGTSFQEKMQKLGAIPQSLKGCTGKDLGDEPDQYLRIEAVKQAVAAGVAEWHRRQDARPTDLSVMDQLQKEGLAKIDANGIHQATNRSITLARILDLDPRYGANLRRNLMGMRDYHDGIEISDEHVIEIQNDLDKRYGITCGIDQLERQIGLKCSHNAFHPVREYFDSLPKWDGKNRYSWIIEKILGSPITKINQAFLECFFRGSVARVFVPGCKHDTVLILKSSKQGVRKTSFYNYCTVNIPGAFIEGHEDIISKDGLIIMHRGWIIELGEIDHITTKKVAEILKNFLSRPTDILRPPYGRRQVEMPRSFVVVGTTNQGAFLMDTTGHRRFHVIETGDKPFDLDLFRSEIDQVWAQALEEYHNGKQWWLQSELEAEHQREMESFQAEEPWSVLIDKALAEILNERHRASEQLCEGVTIAEILDKMGIRAEAQNRGQANRAAEILRNMGWSRLENQVRRGHRRLRLWFPPQDEVLEEMSEAGDEAGLSQGVESPYFPESKGRY